MRLTLQDDKNTFYGDLLSVLFRVRDCLGELGDLKHVGNLAEILIENLERMFNFAGTLDKRNPILPSNFENNQKKVVSKAKSIVKSFAF